jgi:hypothetical protein
MRSILGHYLQFGHCLIKPNLKIKIAINLYKNEKKAVI